MASQLVLDYVGGPFGKVGRFTVSLEVEAERFVLETGYSSSGIKELVAKWARYGQELNLTTTTTDAARKMLAQVDHVRENSTGEPSQ